jgi:ribosome-associated translation inhibitor RaiA
MNERRIDFEFFSETDSFDEPMRAKVEREIRELAGDHSDITGASIGLEEVSHDATPHRFEARIVIYMRPDDQAVTEKAETAETAMNRALHAVTRRVREYRSKLRKRWRQP